MGMTADGWPYFRFAGALGRVAASAVLALGAALLACAPARAQELKFHLEPGSVMGPNACAQCHKSEIAAWQQTHHSTQFTNLYRLPDAQKIAQKMDVRLINRDSLCMTCHYTVQSDANAGGQPSAIAGVSCESCHGAAKSWINVHNNLKVPEHLSQAAAAGMILPTDYYGLAANCFSCHTVPQEKLVNVGGHVAGSALELVSWSQGEVRHNFLLPGGKSGDKNAPATQNALRMLYVMGRIVDLEYGLRGTAKATENANYGKALAYRTFNARKSLQAVADATHLADVSAIIAASGSDADLKVNNAAVLNAAADRVSQLARTFAKQHDGSDLAAVDALIPSSDKYVGTVFQP
jgi:hypothetical protein